MFEGGGGVSMNDNFLYRNFWYNPTYFLGDSLAKDMGFLKQMPKLAKLKISIQQKNPFQ